MVATQNLLFKTLAALGAGDFAHLNGSLEQHLIGVHDLLRDWGADEALCRSGLYHAAYGTAGFDAAMTSLERRGEIAGLIGAEAEAIVYDYCACDRRIVWPKIGQDNAVMFHDRFTGVQRHMAIAPLRAFCELSCANELELAFADAAFADRTRDQLGPLFRQWSPYLSNAARQALDRAYPMA